MLSLPSIMPLSNRNTSVADASDDDLPCSSVSDENIFALSSATAACSQKPGMEGKGHN
jgi:hypothetical protein